MTNRNGYIITDQHAIYFLTFTVVGWVDLFTRQACRDILIKSFRHCIQYKGLIINAYVFMSSHVHVMARADSVSDGMSNIIRDFKKYTAKALMNYILTSSQESRRDWLKLIFAYHAKFNKNNSKYQIWQQNNQPKICLHPKFINQKIRYIHGNPVVAGIVNNPEDYLYCSAQDYSDGERGLLEIEIIDFGIEEGYVLT